MLSPQVSDRPVWGVSVPGSVTCRGRQVEVRPLWIMSLPAQSHSAVFPLLPVRCHWLPTGTVCTVGALRLVMDHVNSMYVFIVAYCSQGACRSPSGSVSNQKNLLTDPHLAWRQNTAIHNRVYLKYAWLQPAFTSPVIVICGRVQTKVQSHPAGT